MSTFFSYSYVQQIYPKQELNASAAGNITGLTFYVDPSVTITDSSDWTVYLGIAQKQLLHPYRLDPFVSTYASI
ncbi:hypothetical protein EJ377_15300 [Chryseobacterium arthrosphaerae]|uniref:Uncharacterized protein n=1 Tax=Chryseobacterium arthrosphaerae TaxID=651561 RepID=A0A3S0Q469_9FLAO|nr:hypothetical protein EJ377_15300 [Chryseobacterium arthrosphaerae]